jgi:hypothetical protein
MPLHRSLNLKKFVNSIDWALMERYIKKQVPSKLLPVNIIMDGEYVNHLLTHLKKEGREDLSKKLLEGFTKLNDIGHKTMNVLVRACDLYNISHSGSERKANLAMRLYLNHPEAFRYAYDRYCYYASSSTIREYPVAKAPGKFTKAKIDAFKKLVSDFYGRQEKGYEVDVRHHDDGPESFLVVDRGSYYQTQTVWKAGKIDTITYRPADEDVLIFNRDNSILSIKAPYNKDRRNYRAAFYQAIVGDAEPEPDPEALYTLKPVQNGTFDCAGDETIAGVKLLSVKLRFSKTDTILLTSADLNKALKGQFSSYSLKAGEIVHAKFEFRVILKDKEQRVNVEITPPNITDLYKKAYAPIIADYLITQKVKLK